MYNVESAERARVEKLSTLTREMIATENPTEEKLEHWRGLAIDLGAMLQAAHREIREIRATDLLEVIERLQVQLAGCGAAAYGDISEPVKQGEYGWSASYQAVVELRKKYEQEISK